MCRKHSVALFHFYISRKCNLNVVGYVSAYHDSYYLCALYDLEVLRLFEQLDDSRGMSVSRNDNFRKFHALFGILYPG